MAKSRLPEGPVDAERRERRRRPRGPQEELDWENIVLRRMARRVRSLSSGPQTTPEAATERGWEEAALAALRKRVHKLDPE